MPTLVFVHAHPDDEGTLTAGSMARASAEGNRVVLVFATAGEHGEVPADLAPGEALSDRRRAEALESARLAGVAEVHWLGYADSGMTGWAQNHAADALCRADLDEAAGRLAAILDDEDAEVVVGYDWHGNYGHPDHVAVHRVVRHAVGLCRVARPRLFEATMNRDVMRDLYAAAVAAGLAGATFDPDLPMDDGNPLGTPAAELHLRVDVRAHLPIRRRMLAAHASQAGDIQAFLSMPEEVFATLFGYEHFQTPGRTGPLRDGWLLPPPSTG